MNITNIKNDLMARGFSVTNENNVTMGYAYGSIANYKKCSVNLSYPIWGNIAGEWFYSVRYESFAESGQPEVDHHIVSESYVAESKIADFMRSKGIYTDAELAERRAEIRNRLRKARMQRG